MNTFRTLLGAMVLGVALAGCSQEAATTVSAPEAWDKLQKGEITLIDIRRPDEWRQTGVARGALEINMLHPQGPQGFARQVLAEVGGDYNAPIVLICRTGNRTSQMQRVLSEAGFTRVSHVGEGMAGSRHGAGWVARGLPVEPCKTC